MAALKLATLAAIATADNATLPWLHVHPVDSSAHPNSTRGFFIADEYNREVMLHGVCLEAEERTTAPWQRPIDPSAYQGQCPPNYAQYGEPPICGVDAGKGRFHANASDLGGNDFAQIRALGLNVVRLCLSWSDLEPLPGQYSAMYVGRVQQLLSWAGEQGVYVILDMHEDLYSLWIQPDNSTGPGIPGLLVPGGGQDGAPAWAIDADGWPALGVLGVQDLNLKVLKSFQAFYDNSAPAGVPQGASPGPGLQDHYIGALAFLLRPFLNVSTVLGIELMNEPLPGLQLDPIVQAREGLYRFYRRAVQAITGLRDGLPECPPGIPAGTPSGNDCAYPDLGLRDLRHIVFAEPSAERNLLDFSPMVPEVWSNYSNLVHTPHVYTHVFTADQEIPWLFPNTTTNQNGTNVSMWSYPPSWDLAYVSGTTEAVAMRSALFVTEFGAGMHEDSWLVEPTMDAAEKALANGWTLWSFKSNCGWGPACANEAWTVYTPGPQNGYPLPSPPNSTIPQNGPLGADRERIVGRTMVRGVAGELLAFHFNTTAYTGGGAPGDEPPRSFWMFANVSMSGWKNMQVAGQEQGQGWFSALSRACVPTPAGGKDEEEGGERRPLDSTSCTVQPGRFTPSLPSLLSSNGSITEVYIPRSVPLAYVLTVIAPPGGVPAAVSVRNTVVWPDGSRSVYVNVAGPGLYGLAVGPPPTVAPVCVRWNVGGEDACGVVRGEEGAEALLGRLRERGEERGRRADEAYRNRAGLRSGAGAARTVSPEEMFERYREFLRQAAAAATAEGYPLQGPLL